MQLTIRWGTSIPHPDGDEHTVWQSVHRPHLVWDEPFLVLVDSSVLVVISRAVCNAEGCMGCVPGLYTRLCRVVGGDNHIHVSELRQPTPTYHARHTHVDMNNGRGSDTPALHHYALNCRGLSTEPSRPICSTIWCGMAAHRNRTLRPSSPSESCGCTGRPVVTNTRAFAMQPASPRTPCSNSMVGVGCKLLVQPEPTESTSGDIVGSTKSDECDAQQHN